MPLHWAFLSAYSSSYSLYAGLIFTYCFAPVRIALVDLCMRRKTNATFEWKSHLNQADYGRGELGDDPFVAIERPQADTVALLEAQTQQAGRQTLRLRKKHYANKLTRVQPKQGPTKQCNKLDERRTLSFKVWNVRRWPVSQKMCEKRSAYWSAAKSSCLPEIVNRCINIYICQIATKCCVLHTDCERIERNRAFGRIKALRLFFGRLKVRNVLFVACLTCRCHTKGKTNSNKIKHMSIFLDCECKFLFAFVTLSIA